MRFLKILTVFGATLFFGPMAHAAWTSGPGGGSPRTDFDKPGRVAYYDFTDEGDSGTLGTTACTGGVELLFNPDTTGILTGAEVQVYRCSKGGASTTDCVKVCAIRAGSLTCATLTGDENAERSGFQNLQAQSIWVDATANPGSRAARVSVTCH